jgi:hypothetical protein
MFGETPRKIVCLPDIMRAVFQTEKDIGVKHVNTHTLFDLKVQTPSYFTIRERFCGETVAAPEPGLELYTLGRFSPTGIGFSQWGVKKHAALASDNPTMISGTFPSALPHP